MAEPSRLTHMGANHWILIRMPSQNIKPIQLVPGSTINLGKFGSFQADDLIGDPFGFTYKIADDSTLSIVEDPAADDFAECDEGLGVEQTIHGDQIASTGLQSLTTDEIEAFKKQGISGEAIVAKVIEGHAAFNLKTDYSKEKYLKRKKQKFLHQFTPEPLGVSELIDLYLDKDSSKIMNISLETLSLMLTYGNVQPGRNYLVIDDTPGIVVAGLLERMDGQGTIVLLHGSEHPNLSILRYLDMTEDQIAQRIKSVNYLDFLQPETADEIVPQSEDELAELKPIQRRQYHRALDRQAKHQHIQQLAQQGFDGLLVMTEIYLPSLIPALLPYVAGSRPIVVYSEYKEQLVNTTNALKSDVRVIAPTIMETRVRKFQTIPGRIHPLMTSRGYGGYILQGLRVIPSTAAQAAGRGPQKRKKAANGEAVPVVDETSTAA